METNELAKIIYDKTLEDYKKNHLEILGLLKKHIPQNLYRYRNGLDSKNEYTGELINYDLKSLQENSLHLSNPKKFNDPFDSKCGIDFKTMINKYPKDKNPLLSIYFRIQAILSTLTKSSSISCFTEDAKNKLMWSHYANYHKGYCLEYDTSTLMQAVKNYKPTDINLITSITPVYYNDFPDIWNDIGNPCPAIFSYLIKDKIWSYEKEWRIFISNAPYNFVNLNYKIPIIPSTVCLENIKPSAIIMGCRIQENIKLMDELIEISKLQNIPLYIAKTGNLKYDLEIIKYET